MSRPKKTENKKTNYLFCGKCGKTTTVKCGFFVVWWPWNDGFFLDSQDSLSVILSSPFSPTCVDDSPNRSRGRRRRKFFTSVQTEHKREEEGDRCSADPLLRQQRRKTRGGRKTRVFLGFLSFRDPTRHFPVTKLSKIVCYNNKNKLIRCSTSTRRSKICHLSRLSDKYQRVCFSD